MHAGAWQHHPMRHELLEQLVALRLPEDDYVLFGSGPLLVRGWIADVDDLDVLARGAAWARAQELGSVEYLAEWNVTVVNIGDHVERGDLIGEIPDGQLGARVHASLSGRVAEVGGCVGIERR